MNNETSMSYPLTTTLRRIFDADPCESGRDRALAAAGKTEPDDEPIEFQQIVEAVGLDDALWCCRAEPQHARLWRLYGVWCAREVQHLMADPRGVAALDVAERHANGLATDEELDAAWDAAEVAALAAARDGAWDAARAAALAARAAARDAAEVAALAAWDAAEVAALAAARDGAWDAAWDAAREAAREAQRQAFIQLVTTGALPDVAVPGVCEK